MIYRLLIIFALLSGCTTYPTAKFDDGQFVCQDANHQPINIVTGYKARFLEDLAYATWNEETKQREIHLSDTIYETWTLPIVKFVAYHECAHHQLDHIDTSEFPEPRLLWSDKVFLEEQDADCEAAKTFYTNHGEDKYESMLADLDAAGFLPPSRIRRIQNCITN